MLKFENFEEGYKYFYENRIFISDTITSQLTPTLLTNSTESSYSKTTTMYGTDAEYYTGVVNTIASLGFKGFYSSISANYGVSIAAQYAYRRNSAYGPKSYYSANCTIAQNNLEFAMSGFGTISKFGLPSTSGGTNTINTHQTLIQRASFGGLIGQEVIDAVATSTVRLTYSGDIINLPIIISTLSATYREV
ncbi:hypothetical protein [Thalassobellus citreus]|uniref:hypothetical protein n=1 Tax=Thalassobellus citreus TaxID=3367752 RepID=UPI003798F73E